MAIKFLVRAIREAFKEREVVDAISDAIAVHVRSSAAVNSGVTEINTWIQSIDDTVNDDKPTTYFARRLVAAKLKDLAAENSDIARALAVSDNYLPAVMDGLSVDEILTASIPLKDLIAQRAIEVLTRNPTEPLA